MNPMKMPSGLYAFAALNEVNSKKPKSLRRLGLDFVVWKNSNDQWIAQLDRCPHRSAKLSQGWIQESQDGDKCIVCPFHGFQFSEAGDCKFIPEIKRPAPGLKVQSWTLIEKYDFL